MAVFFFNEHIVSMAHYQQHVQGFSPDGNLFASINEQGLLRLWDTETSELKQEFASNLHLTGPCTALLWITADLLGTNTNNAKKSRTSSNHEEAVQTLYLLLGSSSGKVSLYSYAGGNIERQLVGEGHNGKITGMVVDKNDVLYTCGDDCQIIIWSLSNGCRVASWNIGKDKPCSLAYLQKSSSLVVGTRQISVYSLATQELQQTFTGHTSEIDLIHTLSLCGFEYIITTSRMERVISMWKLGKKGKNKPALCTFLMEDTTQCLACTVDIKSKQMRLASVTRSGFIHFYLANIMR